MKSSRLFSIVLVMSITIPTFSFAQDSSTDTEFTGHAFVLGFLILSVIVLILAGLLLTARVNELRRTIKGEGNETSEKEDFSHKIMNMEPGDIKAILDQRKQKVSNSGNQTETSQ